MSVISREQSMDECDALMDAAVAARRADDLDATATALQACIDHPCAPHECGHCGWDPAEERATRVPIGEVAALADALHRPVTGPQSVKNEKIGRNAPCPCGSGRKYKRCHGR